jgi:hypothetical protein
MVTKQLRKEKISIKIIGPQRFWIGLVAGIVSAIVISLIFNYSREILRFFTTLSADLLILDNDELRFFNYFYAILSTTLGLSVSMWIWMENSGLCLRRERLYKNLSRTNALLIFWVILMVIARLGSILFIILYGRPGYEEILA